MEVEEHFAQFLNSEVFLKEQIMLEVLYRAQQHLESNDRQN